MRKNIEERVKDIPIKKKEAQVKEESNISFAKFIFVVLAAFLLGLSIAQYQAQKHLDEIELPKCNCAIETPEKLESLEVVEENAGY